ncbi:hypothetical protein HID58_065837 [Brassica napus]|uniref:BP28 C-terminal domain-containing protein n=1 Tax=Brassica napus TaxID=3708 RepID=A0ABQ7ZE86_BRANA|nr:hypothetical protein HID58_065837 [Brassica napus]
MFTWINNMVTESSEEVIPLLLSLCKKQQTSHDKVDIVYGSSESIQEFVEDKIKKIQTKIENTGLAQLDEAELAAVWGAVNCCPYFKVDSSLLIRFKNTLRQHLAASDGTNVAELTGFCPEVMSQNPFYWKPHPQTTPCPELQANNAEDAFDIFSENLRHPNKDVRLMTLRILCHFEPLSPDPCVEEHPPPMKKLKTEVVQKSPSEKNDVTTNVSDIFSCVFQKPYQILIDLLTVVSIYHHQVLQILKTVGESRPTLRSKKDLDAVRHLPDGRIHDAYLPLVFNGMIGLFHTNNGSTEIWESASKCLADLMMKHTSALWNGLMESFNAFISPFNGTPTADVVSLLLKTLQKVPSSHASDVLPLLLEFMGYNSENPLSVGLYYSEACKGEEWKRLLKQWLALLKLMMNTRSSRFSQFVNDVLQYRFLDDNDAEIQMSVLEFLVLSNDYLLPHRHRLENLIKPKGLREELTTWNFSKDIEEAHRSHFVSLVVRILMPKVGSLKNSASRERTSIFNRKAVLGVISQLDVNELSLFFALLMKPLNIISDEATDLFWSSGKSSLDYFQKSKFSKYINVDALSTLSWKMKSGFLHVIQDIHKIFDIVFHVRPFLDFLMGCVVRLLVNNAPNIDEEKIVSTNHDQAGTSLKQFKELRSLCLKIIARVLKKYEDCELGSEFWDLFFSAVNPLIKSFKQEGSSSEKPSSLFTCFLSMSKSPNLVTFLCREESLVPDIFSIPTVTTASEAIKSSALSFIKSLLSLEKDMEDDDHKNKGFLNPYIDALINNLHSLFCGNILRRKSFKYHGEREIKILKLLSKHIRDESHVMKYLNILLSFLDKRVKYSGMIVSPLLVDAEPDVRLCICNLLESLAKIDFSLYRVAKCVSDMNATSPMEVDDLDYETIMDAYANIDVDFFNESSEQHMMIILSQSLYNMTSKEVMLKDCACNLLCTFIEFSASLLCQEASAHSDSGKEVSKSVARWTGDRVLWIMNKFILKHIGDAVNNGISSGKGEILLIRKMVMSLPDSGNLAAFRPLCSENDDLDFFKNVFNIQAHRRAKAINSFAKEIKDSSLPEFQWTCDQFLLGLQGVVRKLLVSIFFNMLLDGQERKGQDSKGRVKKGQNSKDENVRDACEEALASLSAHMSWNLYYALLNRCFQEMKRLLNLVCLILDKFHFAKGGEAHEEIRGCLEKTLYPKITKLFDSESDGVNFNAYVAAVKVLKLLPKEIMDSNIDSLVNKLSNFLRDPMESTREGARKALAACLKELGLENYLQLVLKKLVSLLTKGSEVHVLGYTVNHILSKCLPSPTGWKLDHCLEDLLDVVKADILGDVDEQKEDKKDSIRRRKKKKETIKHKSLDSLRLIAENVTFRSHALTLLSPVTKQLQGPMTSKLKSALKDMLKHIAIGLEGNPSVDQGDLFCFIYHRVDDNKSGLRGQKSSQPSKKKRKSRRIQDTSGAKSCPYLITVFALDLLHNRLNRIQPNNTNEELVSSWIQDVVSSSTKCFTALLRLQLPSFKSEAREVKTKVLAIAQSAVSSSSTLVQSCLKLLTALVSNDNFKLSSEELKMLIQFRMFSDLESDSSVASLSLLKAIVRKKLKVSKIYDVVDQVSRLMITHQDKSIRNKCGDILVEFLVNYASSEKRLEGHFNFLQKNLSCEHSTGREAVLDVLQKLIHKFPDPNPGKQSKPSLGHQSVVGHQSQNLFIELALHLERENDQKLLAKICDVMKLLIGCMTNYKSSLKLSLGWRTHGLEEQRYWGYSLKPRKSFQRKKCSILLKEAKTILESALKLQNTVEEGSIPLWKEAYYSLVMIEKMLKQFPHLCFHEDSQEDFKDVWTMVF